MKLRTALIIACALTGAAALSACTSDIQARDTGCTSNCGDVSQEVNEDASVEDGEEQDVVTGPVAPGTYNACEDSSACDSAQACVDNVCVSTPTADSHVAVELPNDRGGVVDFPDIPPELGCYAPGAGEDPNPAEGAPPEGQTVTVYGDIERFGDGPPTYDVCVSFYDNARLLTYLEESACNDLPIGDERIDCFRRDACRCDELGTASEQTACHADIGNCNHPDLDADARQACLDRFGGPVIYSYGKSICEDGAGNEIGCRDDGVKFLFRIPDVPVNTELAVKCSGLEQRWVDTFEYGVILPWKNARLDETDPVTGGSPTFSFEANVIAIGAWDSIPTTAGLPFPIDKPTSGAVAGIMRDCGLEGRHTDTGNDDVPELERPQAIVHGTVGFTQTPQALTYFNGNPSDSLPQPGRVDSNSLGIYAALGIPYGKNRVAVRTTIPEDAVPAGLDCSCEGGVCACPAGSRNVFVPPFSVVIATFEELYEL